MIKPIDINEAWLRTLQKLHDHGNAVAPRGYLTYELPHHTVCIDTRQPVLLVPERKLSYGFMAAEAYWILTGDNRVSTIAPFNKNISQFSDDGETFAGAYGPRILEQLDYVVEKLAQDELTRQAGLTIWQPNPAASKDIPCTVAIWFQLREHRLHCHVFMRSSDVWLGLPYDLFNFSMLTHLVCAKVRTRTNRLLLEPGHLYLTMASSHLYDKQLREAEEVLDVYARKHHSWHQPVTPAAFYVDQTALLSGLKAVRGSTKTDRARWWLP